MVKTFPSSDESGPTLLESTVACLVVKCSRPLSQDTKQQFCTKSHPESILWESIIILSYPSNIKLQVHETRNFGKLRQCKQCFCWGVCAAVHTRTPHRWSIACKLNTLPHQNTFGGQQLQRPTKTNLKNQTLK